MPKILTESVLTRISEEEKREWQALADASGVALPLLVRRVMANVCGKPEMIERVERQVAEAKVNRALHMRKFLPPVVKKSEPGTHRAAG
jgi:hypothetical protein